jgi:hypothetical protein
MNTTELHSEHSGKPTGKVYQLVYLADLDTVPVDRLDQLFAELKVGLLGLHMVRETAKAMAAIDNTELPEGFVRLCEPEVGVPWKDDGKGEIKLILPKERDAANSLLECHCGSPSPCCAWALTGITALPQSGIELNWKMQCGNSAKSRRNKKMDTYILGDNEYMEDDHGNIVEMKRLGISAGDAYAMLESLNDCVNCWNCEYCEHCKDCVNCKDCKDCGDISAIPMYMPREKRILAARDAVVAAAKGLERIHHRGMAGSLNNVCKCSVCKAVAELIRVEEE